jgi:hypothetical protein
MWQIRVVVSMQVHVQYVVMGVQIGFVYNLLRVCGAVVNVTLNGVMLLNTSNGMTG